MVSFGHALRSRWMLDESLTYLNHGTVGAPPRAVIEAQRALSDEIERQPAQFLLRELADTSGVGVIAAPRMRYAAARVAAFVGVDAKDLAFVDNITTGANAVLRSLPLGPDDDVLVTSLGYGGVTNAARYAAARAGAKVRTIDLPFMGTDPAEFTDAIIGALDARSRVLVIDHTTSQTALVLPVRDIVARCHGAGVQVLVDGAHVPGAMALDIAAIDADWYVANLHKWAWTPRSVGILWVNPRTGGYVTPTVTSWGYEHGLAAEFDLAGTRDPTPFLTAPVALDLLDQYGFERICTYNHALARDAAALLSGRWKVPFTTPASMTATMISLPLPASLGSSTEDAIALQASLLAEDCIEVPIYPGVDSLSTRVSIQIYVELDDIDRFARAIERRIS